MVDPKNFPNTEGVYNIQLHVLKTKSKWFKSPLPMINQHGLRSSVLNLDSTGLIEVLFENEPLVPNHNPRWLTITEFLARGWVIDYKRNS